MGDTNINTAVGNPDTFVTLHDISNDGSSTISDEVVDYVINKSRMKEISTVDVPSISMKSLC